MDFIRVINVAAALASEMGPAAADESGSRKKTNQQSVPTAAAACSARMRAARDDVRVNDAERSSASSRAFQWASFGAKEENGPDETPDASLL
ncbi:hypothetical protein MRX96_059106 [Rhipicephalus microplus]